MKLDNDIKYTFKQIYKDDTKFVVASRLLGVILGEFKTWAAASEFQTTLTRHNHSGISWPIYSREQWERFVKDDV